MEHKREKTHQEEFTINKIELLSAYKTASNEQKELLEQLFGSEVFKSADVRERIKTFADAAKAVGIGAPEGWEENYSDVEPDILAYLKLRIITKALNEGWEPKNIPGEKRWTPYFMFYPKEEIGKMNVVTKALLLSRAYHSAHSSGAVSFAGASYNSAGVSAYVGLHLVFKSEELAEYAGKQFIEIYADFCFK